MILLGISITLLIILVNYLFCLIMRKKLKLARLVKDIGTEEMSKKLGITRQAYYLIERGISYPKLEVWKKIQDILELRDEEMWEIIKGE